MDPDEWRVGETARPWPLHRPGRSSRAQLLNRRCSEAGPAGGVERPHLGGGTERARDCVLQLRPAEADDRPIQEDVLAHRELVVHSRAQLEHGSEPPAHATGARGGAIDAGEDAEERALARAVIPDQPEGLAFVELEGHVVERSEPTRMPAHPERPAKLVEEAWRPCAG